MDLRSLLGPVVGSLRRPRVLAIVLMVVFGGTAYMTLTETMLYTPDSARYLLWSDALVSGSGFSDPSSPEPSRYVVHAPLYSVLLTPVTALFGPSVVAAKSWTLLLGLLLLGVVYRWLDRRTTPWFAFGAVAFLAFHPMFMLYATQVLSDIPFLLCVLLALGTMLDMRSEPLSGRRVAILAVLLGSCILLREVGVAVVGAVVLGLAWRKEWKAAALMGATSLAIYASWHIRNEIIVGAVEQPPIRNADLFLRHVFTPQSSSLPEELSARFIHNVMVYGDHLVSFMFAPQWDERSFGLISVDGFPVSVALKLVPVLVPVFLAVPVFLLGAALYYRWKQDEAVRMLVLMVAFYAVPVLLYPVNDVRFLFPVMVLLLLLMMQGGHELASRWQYASHPAARYVAASLVLLLMLPNLMWTAAYGMTAGSYARSKAGSTLEGVPGKEYYLKDFSAAGEWVVGHTDAGEVIACGHKEIALWLQGRKAIDVGMHSPDGVDRALRDYRIRFYVTITKPSGIREDEIFTTLSSAYAFHPVASFGVVEILEVRTKEDSRAGEQQDSTHPSEGNLFHQALLELRDGDPVVADSVLRNIDRRLGPSPDVLYNTGVAKALQGDVPGAREYFSRIRSGQQSLDLAQAAWIHEDILDRYLRAREDPDPVGRAHKFNVMAFNYWDLGYRAHAMRMLDSSFNAQPGFFPSLVVGAIFSYAEGMSAQTQNFLREAETVDSMHVLVSGMRSVMRMDERLNEAIAPGERKQVLQAKAQAFAGMGMADEAITVWLRVLDVDSTDQRTLIDLTRMYEAKKRYEPSLYWLNRYIELYPQDAIMAQQAEALRNRW